MYDSGRFLSAARFLSQQNCDMITSLQAYNLVFMELPHSISLMSTYAFIQLNTSLQFYFQCSRYKERETLDKTRSHSWQDEDFPFLQNVTNGPGSHVLFLGVRSLGHETDYSPPSRMSGAVPLLLYSLMALTGDNFTFMLDFLMCLICEKRDRNNTDDGQLYKKPGFWVHIQLHRCHFAIRFVLIIVLL